MTAGRDRDEAGRARQGRPRDALGRPLSYDEVGVEPFDEVPRPPQQTIELALAYLEQGRPFTAHEVFETRWKDGPVEERPLWQGLAQLCVAITHAARGNDLGARRLLDRAAAHLEQHRSDGGDTYDDLDLRLLARARDVVTAPGG